MLAADLGHRLVFSTLVSFCMIAGVEDIAAVVGDLLDDGRTNCPALIRWPQLSSMFGTPPLIANLSQLAMDLEDVILVAVEDDARPGSSRKVSKW